MRDSTKAVALLFTISALLLVGCQSQRTFRSPDDAVTALTLAVKEQDKSALRRMFGPNAEQLKSGDPEQDRNDAIIFARKLASVRRIRLDAPDQATLLVGEDEWPFAVPLVMEKSTWRFDTDAGLDEMTSRRIGRNELLTIAACRTLIDAQAEFFERDPDRVGAKHYAQRLLSTTDKKNGLYWPAPGGVDPSPIGPALALAATRRDESGERIPFNGYFFKLLTRQATSESGGAIDYMENGELTRGWAVIAYPADYGTTGVMSFLCSNKRIVYQKDLGEEGDTLVAQMDAFDPTSGWQQIEPNNAAQAADSTKR